MTQEPKPEDYPDRINTFTRDYLRWKSTQHPDPVSLPSDLEYLFTPESLEAAKKKGDYDGH